MSRVTLSGSQNRQKYMNTGKEFFFFWKGEALMGGRQEKMGNGSNQSALNCQRTTSITKQKPYFIYYINIPSMYANCSEIISGVVCDAHTCNFHRWRQRQQSHWELRTSLDYIARSRLYPEISFLALTLWTLFTFLVSNLPHGTRSHLKIWSEELQIRESMWCLSFLVGSTSINATLSSPLIHLQNSWLHFFQN